MSQELENEIHFLTTCNAYTERVELPNKLSTIVLVLFNKFTFLMSQEGIITTKLLVSLVFKMTKREHD